MDAIEESPGSVARRLLELLPAGSGSVGGALVGLLVGGPQGALVGAALEPGFSRSSPRRSPADGNERSGPWRSPPRPQA
jgi:hypothetical protein